MKKGLVLINNSGVGGAERRFAISFLYLLEQDKEVYLIINFRLYNLLKGAGLFPDNNNIIILKDVVGRFVDRIEESFSLSFLSDLFFYIKKVDYIFFAFKTWSFFRKETISVAHLILGGAYVGLPLFLNKKIRVVISVVCPLKRMVGSIIGLYLYLWALRRADIIDALSNSIKADLALQGFPSEKIAVSPGSFTDTDRYFPLRDKKDWVVFAGRFHKDKTPLLFLEAIPIVLSSFPEARFFLLGEGPLEGGINRKVRDLALSDSVTVKFLPDISEILRSSRIFVSIQKEENYPSQSLLEAMACGNAIIATDVGETRRLVDEKVGILIKEDTEELADAIIRLLADPDVSKAMGYWARERVIREHNIETFTRYLGDLYRKAMKG